MKKKRRMMPQLWLCWFTLMGGLAAYYMAHGDWLTSTVAALIAVSGLAGYRLGSSIFLVFLVTVVASGLCATRVVGLFGPTVSNFLGTFGTLNSILATSIGCISLGLVAMVVFDLVWNRLLGNRGNLSSFDRTCGLALGAVQGVVITSMVLGGALVAEPYARFAATAPAVNFRGYVGRYTADTVAKVGRATRHAPFQSVLQQFNPYERMPQLRRLRQSSLQQFVHGQLLPLEPVALALLTRHDAAA